MNYNFIKSQNNYKNYNNHTYALYILMVKRHEKKITAYSYIYRIY